MIDGQPDGSEAHSREEKSSADGRVHDAPDEVVRRNVPVTGVVGAASENVTRLAATAWLEAQNTLIENMMRPLSRNSSHREALARAYNPRRDEFKNLAISSFRPTDHVKQQVRDFTANAQWTAECAAFSLASGVKVSDSISSMFSTLELDTAGTGLASSLLKNFTAKSEMPEMAKLGTDAASALVKGISEHSLKITRAISTQQLAATSGIAELLATDKLMGSWRHTLLAEATTRALVGTVKFPERDPALLRDLVGINTAAARTVAQLANQNMGAMLSPALSMKPTRELRRHLSNISLAPDISELTIATHASRGVAGVTAADLLISTGGIDEGSSELLEVEVVEPWLTAPRNARQNLIKALGDIDLRIPELLEAAWEKVGLNGPATVSIASHAAVEVIDRTLRAIASDDEVLAAHAAGKIPKDSVYQKDGRRRPTRAGRIAIAVEKCHPGDKKLIASQTKALVVQTTTLLGNLQAGKHESKGTVELIRTYLVAVEAVLTQLLYREAD